jgi:hypothetical protein
MCKTLNKRLNSFNERCADDAIETFPGFQEPPWEELNPAEHENLIAKLLKYRQVGSRQYFESSIEHADSEDAPYRRKAKAFIAAGGRLQVWKTRLVPTFNDRPAPPGTQTVVLMSSHDSVARDPRECPGKRSHGWLPALFLVTPDLLGPDPDVDAGTASILYLRTVLLHDGTPYLVNSDTVLRGFGDAGVHGVCAFKYVDEGVRVR